ncbi:MAG: hypothetical protein E6H49_13745 [Betaproteobacteria bacterium]|jgi:hypothetical protein|nr:MAG: hypothetical protein E6H49_13745 [Betaproteobacteria bacterium]
MRALRIVIVFASAALLTVSAFAADTQVKQSAQRTTPNIVVASAEKHVKQAPSVAKTEAPVRVWTLEMSCCEAQ